MPEVHLLWCFCLRLKDSTHFITGFTCHKGLIWFQCSIHQKHACAWHYCFSGSFRYIRFSSICQEREDQDTLILLLRKQENNFPSNKTRIIMLLSMMVKCSQETNQSFTFLYFLQLDKWLTGFLLFHYLLGCLV